MTTQSSNISDKKLKEMVHELGYENEEQLHEDITKNWNIAYCSRCGRKIDLLSARYIDGDPICPKGCVRNG